MGYVGDVLRNSHIMLLQTSFLKDSTAHLKHELARISLNVGHFLEPSDIA